MAFVRNAWYVADWAAKVDSTPRRRTMPGDDIVLYCTTNGDPVALRVLCPHRFPPLSQDKVVMEAIQIEEERHGTRGRVGLDLDDSAGPFRRMIAERLRDEAPANGG